MNEIVELLKDGKKEQLKPKLLKIKLLDLSYKKLGDQEILTLKECLRNNFSLYELYLYNNNIGDNGAKILSEFLSCNNCLLEKLDLYQNNITDVGIKYFYDVLKNREGHIKLEICLENNKYSKDGKNLMMELENNSNSYVRVKMGEKNQKPFKTECLKDRSTQIVNSDYEKLIDQRNKLELLIAENKKRISDISNENKVLKKKLSQTLKLLDNSNNFN